jgi:hypothetical protein
MSETVVNVSIKNMTCGSCTYKIESEVSDMSDDVTFAKCDLQTQSGTFKLKAGATTKAEDIVKLINSLDKNEKMKFEAALL